MAIKKGRNATTTPRRHDDDDDDDGCDDDDDDGRYKDDVGVDERNDRENVTK